MTPDELAEPRADAYVHGADALEFLGYTLIALDVANTVTGVLAGPDVGLAGVPMLGAVATLRSGAARGIGSLDDLSRAAAALDRNGLTRAARARQKYGHRPGSALPQVRGHENLNRAGQTVVDDILTISGATRSGNRFGGIDVLAPGGRGVRYDASGNFIGFLETRP